MYARDRNGVSIASLTAGVAGFGAGETAGERVAKGHCQGRSKRRSPEGRDWTRMAKSNSRVVTAEEDLSFDYLTVTDSKHFDVAMPLTGQ